MKDVSYVTQLSFAKPVTNVPTVALDLPVGARLHKFWEPWEDLGASLKVVKILKEGYALCQSPQEPLPVEGITSAFEQKYSRDGQKANFLGLLQPDIFGSQT